MDIHSNGKFIKVSNNLIPQLTRDVNIQVISGYVSDQELRLVDRNYIYSRPILPIPVLNSPLLVSLMYHPKDPDHWKPRYSTSIAVLSMLRSIQACYSINPHLKYYQDNKERINNAVKSYQERVDSMDTLFYQQIKTVNGEHEFINLLCNNTCQHIEALECCIMEMFNINYIKPNINNNTVDIPLGLDEHQLLYNVCEHFFSTKQELTNTRLQQTGNDPQVWFQPTNDTNLNFPTLKYLSCQRVREYYNYCLIE